MRGFEMNKIERYSVTAKATRVVTFHEKSQTFTNKKY